LYLIAIHVFPLPKFIQKFLKNFLIFKTDFDPIFGLSRLTGRPTVPITGQNGQSHGLLNLWQKGCTCCTHS